MGGISSMMIELGHSTPNANSNPISAPDAPSNGMPNSPVSPATPICTSAAPTPQTM